MQSLRRGLGTSGALSVDVPAWGTLDGHVRGRSMDAYATD